MASAPSSDSTQGVVALSASGAAGSVVKIVSSTGDVLTTFTAKKAFTSVVYSSAKVDADATYSVTVGS